MKTNTAPHLNCRNEHQFGTKNRKIGNKETKRKEIEKKDIVKLIVGYIVCALLVATLLEWFPISDFLGKTLWEIGKIACSTVLTLLFSFCVNTEKISAEENVVQSIFGFIKQICTKKTLAVLGMMLLIWTNLCVAQFIAGRCFTGRMIHACEEAIEGFKSYDKEKDKLFEKSELTAEQNEWIEEQDQELVREAKNSEVPDNERKVIKNLSDNDKNQIFFLNQITNWEDQDLVNREVCAWVINQREKKRENLFDKPDEEGGAPLNVETAICNASENEKNVRFVGRKAIMEERSNIYEEYPKYSLSNLISNDNHALALALYYYCGQDSTIMYHYGQAILYNMEGISYAEVSNSTCKERLTAISQRYLDIEYTCESCEEIQYAKKLAIAFQHAADQY